MRGQSGKCANCILSQRRGSPHFCVPNACQLDRIRPSSIVLKQCFTSRAYKP